MRSEDGQIIRECLDGDSASFGLLVDKYKASIYALAYSRLHNFHDAEDIAQDTFLKAYENLRTLRRWDSFLVWIRSIAINLCKNKLRMQSRLPDTEPMEDRETLEKASADRYRNEQSSISRDETLGSLNKAMESLPEIYQQVLTLHYLGGMSGEQMSQFLGISHASVRKRLSRARRQLREEVLAMMSSTYEQQRLQAGFTFRIVEAVKRIRINPMPRMAGTPWGLSLAVGIIITVLSLNPHISTDLYITTPAGSPLPVETRVLKTGEIPVDILKTSKMLVISSNRRKDNREEPQPMNRQKTFLAPHREGGTWESKADLPTTRQALSTTAVNGKIYAIGGVRSNGWVPFPTVEEYNPATDTWTRKADMPTPRFRLVTCALDGKIYAIGGSGNNWQKLSAVEEYDPATDTWTRKADMQISRTAPSAAVVNGKIYAIGGVNQPDVSIGRVEEYDPVTDTWTRKADMPTARYHPSLIVVDKKIYAVGGIFFLNNNGNRSFTPLPTVEVYDPATDIWIKKDDMPEARDSDLAFGFVNGKLYLFGGAEGERIWEQSYTTVKTVRSYDPETGTFTKEADMPSARGEASASVMDGNIYVIGGVPGWAKYPAAAVSLPTVEEYNPEGLSVSPQGKLPTTWGEIKSD